MVEIGAGDGALTLALAARDVDVLAVEIDPRMAARLRERLARKGLRRVAVRCTDFLSMPLPEEPFRVVASIPYGRTTDVLRRLLDDPRVPMRRADLVVQWEVARKRAAQPPATLNSTVWAPWWEFRLGRRIPSSGFRPAPRVDSGVLVVSRRDEPLLPPAMAGAFAGFVRDRWPFSPERSGRGSGARRR